LSLGCRWWRTLGPLGQLAREPNSTHYQRSETAAALIRKLILEDKMTDPMAIARVVVEKMKARQVRPTKNLFMVCTMIKDYLLKLHFKPLDPTLHTWRHVARQLKPGKKFTAEAVAAIDPDLGIPAFTPVDKIAKDGRHTRSGRHKQVPLMGLCRHCSNALTRPQLLDNNICCSHMCARRSRNNV
jgi:hypothetical protein